MICCTSSVQNALAAQQQSSFSSGSKFSSTGSTSSSLSSSSSSSSSSSKSDLVRKILNILQPRIVTLVSEAFSAQQAQAAALAEQQRLEQIRIEKLRIEKQRQEQIRIEKLRIEQQRIEQQRQEQIRIEKLRIEQQRQEQIRIEQLRIEQQRQQQLKQLRPQLPLRNWTPGEGRGSWHLPGGVQHWQEVNHRTWRTLRPAILPMSSFLARPEPKLALPSVTIVFSTDVTNVAIVFSVAADSSVWLT